ncbi:MAG: RNA-binding domain-containing protein [archaeon]
MASEKPVEPAMLKAETFCHLTEDLEVVRGLFIGLFPGKEIQEEKLYGHYKNEIVKLSYSTDERNVIEAFLKRALPCAVPDVEDNKRAYFRLSKNDLIEGKVSSAEEGKQAVSVEVSFKVFGGADLDASLLELAGVGGGECEDERENEGNDNDTQA